MEALCSGVIVCWGCLFLQCVVSELGKRILQEQLHTRGHLQRVERWGGEQNEYIHLCLASPPLSCTVVITVLERSTFDSVWRWKACVWLQFRLSWNEFCPSVASPVVWAAKWRFYDQLKGVEQKLYGDKCMHGCFKCFQIVLWHLWGLLHSDGEPRCCWGVRQW